jgi:hypothetical protein
MVRDIRTFNVTWTKSVAMWFSSSQICYYSNASHVLKIIEQIRPKSLERSWNCVFRSTIILRVFPHVSQAVTYRQLTHSLENSYERPVTGVYRIFYVSNFSLWRTLTRRSQISKVVKPHWLQVIEFGKMKYLNETIRFRSLTNIRLV